MRWLLCHRVCCSFVQWICFIGSSYMHVTLFMKFTLQYYTFLVLGYLPAVQVSKHVIPLRTETAKTTALIVHMQTLSVPLTDTLLEETPQQQRNPTLYRLRCALFVVLNPDKETWARHSSHSHLLSGAPSKDFSSWVSSSNSRYQLALEVFLLKQ